MSKLTTAEALQIYRRRAKWSQPTAAQKFSVSLYRLRRWELGKEDPPDRIAKKLPTWAECQWHERCFVVRERRGVPLKTLAKRLGISRWWLCRMEYGTADAAQLVEYWEGRRAL